LDEGGSGEILKCDSWRTAGAFSSIFFIGGGRRSLKDGSEKAIISVLGILYVLIRSVAIGQAIAFGNVVNALDERLDEIQYFVNAAHEKLDRSAVRDELSYQHVKLYIDVFFLGLISLGCLWSFFTAHS
jgi:hypothetical protein